MLDHLHRFGHLSEHDCQALDSFVQALDQDPLSLDLVFAGFDLVNLVDVLNICFTVQYLTEQLLIEEFSEFFGDSVIIKILLLDHLCAGALNALGFLDFELHKISLVFVYKLLVLLYDVLELILD